MNFITDLNSVSAANEDNKMDVSFDAPPSKPPVLNGHANSEPPKSEPEHATVNGSNGSNGASSDPSPKPAEDATMANESKQAEAAPAQPIVTETPSLNPPQLQTDFEMKDVDDVPPSPSKLSREREEDPAEEPAAKRTKVDGEEPPHVEFKLPEPQPPATEAPVPETPVVETPVVETPTTQAPAPAQGSQPGITKMQHKFLTKSLASLRRMHDSRFYREPVDPIKLNIPSYFTIITQPMDLGTMEAKLRANEYTSPQAVFEDCALMVQNSVTFNTAEHLVSQEGLKLKATFEKQMQNLPRADQVEEKKPKKVTEKTSAARREPRTSIGSTPAKAASPQNTTFALGPEGLPVIRRDSSNPDRPKRSIHPPKRDLPYSTKPKKKKFQWELRFCQDTINELMKPKHMAYAAPFYYPVDPVALNIPTYHNIIKKPMDLSTVQSKLKTGQYENAKEFENDVTLMFKNCFRFNLEGDPTYACGKQLEGVFHSQWAKKEDYLEKHEPAPEQTDSSDNDSDAEAEGSDEDNEKINALQRQIAEMSRQVEMMTQKKKTPPAGKKAAKAKSGKKDAKKSSGSKKTSKTSKGEKQRHVTYDEKQTISNGISSLPDKKMQEALMIIQNNVPALKVRLLCVITILQPRC